MREEETSEKEEKTPEDKYEKKYSEVPAKIGKKFDEMEEEENESEDFKAVGDNVIIEPKPITESIKDGVAASVESGNSGNSIQGKVIAVGPGKFVDDNFVRPSVSKGDSVIFSRYCGDDIVYDGKKYKIISADNIKAILKG